jgi:hypothetical protein
MRKLNKYIRIEKDKDKSYVYIKEKDQDIGYLYWDYLKRCWKFHNMQGGL